MAGRATGRGILHAQHAGRQERQADTGPIGRPALRPVGSDATGWDRAHTLFWRRQSVFDLRETLRSLASHAGVVGAASSPRVLTQNIGGEGAAPTGCALRRTRS